MKVKILTYFRLGIVNIARVVAYRLSLKVGLHPAQRLAGEIAQPPFYRFQTDYPKPSADSKIWRNKIWWFGWYDKDMPVKPPNWFENPFSPHPQPNASKDWWEISDFGAGDVKGLWEMSRMHWVPAWAVLASNDDSVAAVRINEWIADWARQNPPYKGPNWKCGQEASIRVMNLAIALKILSQCEVPEAGLVNLLTIHMVRISATLSYAVAQQNNHATSEAAALFIGGCLLRGYDHRAEKWLSQGRYWLENLAVKLIKKDGSFSQYSVTYHRLLLDTYSLAEIWRSDSNMKPFSAALYERLAAATNWLWSMVDANTGDAPNIGANDGVHLLQFCGANYRDFRPTVQLSAAVFSNLDAYGPGPWNSEKDSLGIKDGARSSRPESRTYDGGGFHVMHSGSAMAVLRYPRSSFRPGQSDSLHVDFWLGGRNILRDAGTYSYNDEKANWFASTAAHNTIEFDSREQMPRLSRFLYGNWLNAERVDYINTCNGKISASAAYRDYKGCFHSRKISLHDRSLICVDTVSGPFNKAKLRWRLLPGNWCKSGHKLSCDKFSIEIDKDAVPLEPKLDSTMESLYYRQKAEIPAATVEFYRPGTITTKVCF